MALKEGNIPTLNVKGDSIPEAWENSVVEIYNKGLSWHRQGPKDEGKETLDSTMTIEIRNPDSNLFMHKYTTCGVEDLIEYQMEILGAKDSWVDPTGKSTKWPYHYHERLAFYPGTEGPVNQINHTIEKMTKEPWIRRHNMITWVPEKDLELKDPPCLQKVWFMIVPDESSEDNLFKLNMNYVFRSRNVMIASPMNMTGLYALQCHVRDKVSELSGMNIQNGRIVDFTDSYHVSAHNKHLLEKFIERYEASVKREESSKDRCIDKEIAFDGLNMARIEDKIIKQTEKQLLEKGESDKLEKEIKKIRQISKEVAKINGIR